MNERKRASFINAVGIIILLIALAVMFWLAAGCATNESRTNPEDPKSSAYLTPTPTQ